MKPASFKYVRAENVDHAIEALAAGGDDAKILAGGQSLVPMMNFRLVRPSLLVDINRIHGLDTIEDRGERIFVGALVRHRAMATDEVIRLRLPVLAAAMQHVAHLTVRNRGTFCGSLCHADPAAEMPMLAQLLDAEIHIASPRGHRSVAADAFLIGTLATALEPDELVTGATLKPPAEGAGWGFAEFARRHGDYALAAVAATMGRVDGKATSVHLAVMGVGERAIRLHEVEAELEGCAVDTAALDRAVETLRATIDPEPDPSGSTEYRRHLAGALARRVIGQAWARTGKGAGS